ncbi:MAG: hydantoinase/oxoprolinase family protein [Pseudomonadota bacterium]
MERKTYYCYTDAGGTFTDTFIIDSEGMFISGKASSTPKQLADGHLNSLEEAMKSMALSPEEFFPNIDVTGFGTTAIINTILTRSGIRTGAIVNRGFEKIPFIGRGQQTMTEYGWEDILHSITHRHISDLIPIELIRGATERVDNFGEVMIPLYEHEVYNGAESLIEAGVEAIIIVFIYSYMYPAHELRAKEIVLEVAEKKGKSIEVFTSVEISPVHRELNRFNAVAIEAYGGSVARRSIKESERRMKARGARKPLQIMLSQGGLATVAEAKMIETAMSGPVGGLQGGKFIGDIYGIRDIITTDVGGTSFDVGLITKGRFQLNMEPLVARFLINIPYVSVSSIGAGGGTIAFVDSLTGRLKVGPRSAGSTPGPCCYGQGGIEPTVTDADLVLGYINPGYFLGGRVRLDKSLAEKAIKDKIADPLGVSVVQAAWGIKEIVDTQMENYCRSVISSKGYAVEEYTLMAFGGAGPTHAAGYTRNTAFKNVLMFPYSSVFCAFGAATGDFSHHYLRSTYIFIPSGADDSVKLKMAGLYNELMADMEAQAIEQFKHEGYKEENVTFCYNAFVRYTGQLEDIKVIMPMARVNSPKDMNLFVKTFELEYTALFTDKARYPEAGVLSLALGLTASVTKKKPLLIKRPLATKEPPKESRKDNRQTYFDGEYQETAIYEFVKLLPGNVVSGPAIIEHVDTNYVVPPGTRIEIDEYSTLWLKRGPK